MSSAGGFTMATSATDKGMESRGFESGLLTFQPPNTVHYDIKQKNGSHLYLTSFTTPCAPGVLPPARPACAAASLQPASASL